jgi:uncharacterized protein (TIGR00369 family)
MTLMDTVAGMASGLNLKPGQGFLTVEFKINFLRSVREGRVSAEATAVHIGRRTPCLAGDIARRAGPPAGAGHAHTAGDRAARRGDKVKGPR